MNRHIEVVVEWDAEASVWIASAPDWGLFTEAETLDEIRRKVPVIASDLVDDRSDEPLDLHVELSVRFDTTVSVAA